MKTNKLKPSCTKYGDFNLLMYLAEELDDHTALSIAEIVEREGKLDEAIEELIEHKADLWSVYWSLNGLNEVFWHFWRNWSWVSLFIIALHKFIS